ncbi:hypothetical protein TIFTF001_011239 [Ficus carica]|uniref:Ninja-family protein n=1 Tax=Ficus carica TaxID=3494 RepID=A0AA87ZRB6_FICCA|nr:hypothetical protein TIFTF001_011239 [Ficus carica]
MGEANEGGRSRGLMENFSLEKYPRDLLKRFMCTDQQSSQNAASFRGGGAEEEQEEEDSEELELNLGLSLGGRFGVDKTMKSKKLTRSSSIIGTMPIARDSDDSAALVPPVSSYGPLVRTSSLPTETEEEWRKRKELQTLRRMAAKRRRSEKQRHSSGKAERDDEERDKQLYLASLGAPSTPGARVDLTAKTRQLTSQGSVESHGGGSSSGMSEFESKPVQGI